MNKNDLVRRIANINGCTIKDAEKFFDDTIQAIHDGLKEEKKIQISGFGIFELKEKPQRKAVNPMTGEQIIVAASSTPVLKFGKTFKDSFNK